MNTSIIHPMIVHFPVALILTAFLFASAAIISKKKSIKIFNFSIVASFALLLLGTISAIAAICTGYLFTNEMTGIMGVTRNNHITSAFCTLIIAILAVLLNGIYILKKRESNSLFYGTYMLYLASAILVGITGHLGGAMVFGF